MKIRASDLAQANGSIEDSRQLKQRKKLVRELGQKFDLETVATLTYVQRADGTEEHFNSWKRLVEKILTEENG